MKHKEQQKKAIQEMMQSDEELGLYNLDNLVVVTLKLKPSQNAGNPIKWNCTIKGEKRLTTTDVVKYVCKTIEEASSSFVMDEIDAFNIDWKRRL